MKDYPGHVTVDDDGIQRSTYSCVAPKKYKYKIIHINKGRLQFRKNVIILRNFNEMVMVMKIIIVIRI